MRKTAIFFLSFACSILLWSQDTVFTNSITNKYLTYKLFSHVQNPNLSGLWLMNAGLRCGNLFSPINSCERIYGVGLILRNYVSDKLNIYLYDKQDSIFILRDSISMRSDTTTCILACPAFDFYSLNAMNYEDFCTLYDTITNVNYGYYSITNFFFRQPLEITNDSFAILIGPSVADLDIMSPALFGILCLGLHEDEGLHRVGHFPPLAPIVQHEETPALGIFPIISRDLWEDNYCRKITRMITSGQDGRSVTLRWIGSGHQNLYEVAVGPADSAFESYETYTTTDMWLNYSNLTFGEEYAYRVRGRCFFDDTVECWSEWSDTLRFSRRGFTLTLRSNDESMGVVPGTGIYEPFITTTFEAFPGEGCRFEMWNDSITDNPRTITIVSDTAFTALFAANDAVNSPTDGPRIAIAPNPTNGCFTIRLSGCHGTTTIRLSDAGGRTVADAKADGDATLTFNHVLPQGVYFVHISNPDFTRTEKIVIP